MDTTLQSYETSHGDDEGYAGRIDVVTGPSGRRRWPEHVKASIVLESFRDGISVADVARKHGVSAPQLHAWRRASREGLLPMPQDDALGLVPVLVGSDGGDNGWVSDASSIEIDIAGVHIRVAPGFDPDHLVRVIAAVRSAS